MFAVKRERHPLELLVIGRHPIGAGFLTTNGTFVNSAEASDMGYYLRAGDIISIGDVKMRYEPYNSQMDTPQD